MKTREEIRHLAMTAYLLARGDLRGQRELTSFLYDVADVLSTPTWFSANELRLAADTMDAMNISTADASSLRVRLDGFYKSGAVSDAENFSQYLKYLPNGGVQ